MTNVDQAKKALSIRQPWAWLIIHRFKDVENRGWKTSFRGWFLVHAPQKFDAAGYEWVKSRFPSLLMPQAHEFERGGIVGLARLVDCVEMSSSPWFEGPYGFVLKDARPVPFFLMPGKLGFFVPDFHQNVNDRDSGSYDSANHLSPGG